MARPTARGLALLGIAAATYLAARVLGTWELYLLALTFAAAVLVSWLTVLAATRGLQAERGLSPAHPVAGDTVVVTIRVLNRSLLPGLQVTLEHAAGDLGATDETLALEGLGPRAARTVSTTAQEVLRGVRRLPALVGTAEDPLGLVRASRRLDDPLEITVYPRLTDLHSCVLVGDGAAHERRGERGARAAGTSEFRGIRPAGPGEPLSRVDWKATAKTGTLMVREMGDLADGDITLVLEGTGSHVVGQPPRTNYELLLQALGSAADFALRTGRVADLLLHEERWRQVRLTPDPAGRRLLLEALAAAAPAAGMPLSEALRGRASGRDRLSRTEHLVVGLLVLDQRMVRVLLELRAAGVTVAVVVAPPSFASPRAGAATPSVEDRALLALAAHGVTCVRLSAGDDLRAALAAHPASGASAVGR